MHSATSRDCCKLDGSFTRPYFVRMNANLVEVKARSSGRPRSEPVRRMILATTLRLLEKQTVKAISIEGIAKAAGVSKATIYRWWDSKAAIVLDAFMEHHVVRTPMRKDIPPGDAVAEHIRSMVAQYAGLGGRIVAQILAEAQFDPDIARQFRERFHKGRRAVVRETMEEWRRSGGLSRAVNVDLLMDILYAPIYLRLLTGHAPLSAEFAREFPAFVFSLLGVPTPTVQKKSSRLEQAPGSEAPYLPSAAAKPRRRSSSAARERPPAIRVRSRPAQTGR
jgi:AcrR family transcriptional regulator